MAKSLKQWIDVAAGFDEEGFVARYPHPFLMVLDQSGAASGGDPGASGAGSLTMSGTSVTRLNTLDFPVHLVQKRIVASDPKHPLASVITIGRKSSSDIVVAAASISGVHGFFAERPDGWYLRDLKSRNGTMVDGEYLEPGDAVLLDDDLEIHFAQIGCRFNYAGTFYRLLAQMKRTLA